MNKEKIRDNKNHDLLQSILDNSIIGMSLLKALRDENGSISDFEITLTNRELDKETQRTDLVGKLYSVEYPGILKTGVYEVMMRVMASGRAEGLEYFYPHESFNKWYSCMFVKMDDGLLATNLDITERKKAEQKVISSEERLRMFLTASSDLIYRTDADWQEVTMLNNGVDLENEAKPIKNWLALYIPSHEHTRFKEHIGRSFRKKEMFVLEHQMFLPNGSIGWMNSRAIPVLNHNGDVVQWFGVSSDITAKKVSQEQRDRHYLLLQQSEEVACTGTWHYDLTLHELTWSEGMYRLYEIRSGTRVGLGRYALHAAPGFEEKAARVANLAVQPESGFEDILHIKSGEIDKMIRIKATVIKAEDNRPISIIGVDMDVTASFHTEEKIRKMEKFQQLEILKATLNIQEEERRRISESLHNGLGQLLYGIKLSLDKLSLNNALEDGNKFAGAKKYTEKLLTEAILDCRRISHLLMPAVLDEFGLQSALDEVGRQLIGKVKFDCHYSGLQIPMEKFLELAIFRTVQELMLNVVKHAQATHCQVVVKIIVGGIEISVKDNGKGIGTQKGRMLGIGLSTIKTKINLLNGKLIITSKSGKGTHVVVTIPMNA